MRLFVVICMVSMISLTSCGSKTADNSKVVDDFQKEEDINSSEHSLAEGDMRFLCYNVRHCRGMDDKVSYDRIVNIIKELNPDFVALQELDSATTRTDGVNQVKELGDRLNMHSYFGGAIPYRGGKYGVGILSKKPALNTYLYNLPGKEPRAVLIAEYDDFLILSTHLDLVEGNRAESAKIITEKIKGLNKKAYLAGDFNESNFASELFIELKKEWTIVSPIKNTFSTNNPSKCIDFVVTYNSGGEYKVSKSNVVYDLPEINVPISSDHFPLYIDFH